MTTNPQAGPFRPVNSGRMSEAVVQQLRTMIRTGDLPIGERLPSERELCEQLRVSRLSLREALRVLESSGLLEVRLGARGGAFVTAPTAGQAGEGIVDLLSTSGLSAANVTEARTLFELGIVSVVAERATDEDIRELRALCDREERTRSQDTYTVDVSFDFHLRVAVTAHNPAVAMLLTSFREAILMSMWHAHHEGTQGVDEHRAFVDAIERRDPEHARRVMAAHLKRTADAVAQ